MRKCRGGRRDGTNLNAKRFELELASFDEITSIIEVAVTWHELDYSDQQMIDPDDWLDFVAEHTWTNPERVLDFFLALRSMVSARSARRELAMVVPLHEGDYEPGLTTPVATPSRRPWSVASTDYATGGRDRCGSEPSRRS